MRRKKADFHDLPPFVDCMRVRRKDGLRGWRYILSSKVKPDTIYALESLWRNVTIGTCTYRYAPQITHYTVILWDKCI